MNKAIAEAGALHAPFTAIRYRNDEWVPVAYFGW